MNSVQESFSQFGQNSAFVEELYAAYLANPDQVGEPWISFFKDLESVTARGGDARAVYEGGEISLDTLKKQAAVSRLIGAYREFGYLKAKINPLSHGVAALPDSAELLPETYGLTSHDLDQSFHTDGLLHEGYATLGEILSKLEDTYCGSIGCEFSHLRTLEEKEFLRERIEDRGAYGFSPEEKRSILKGLIDSEMLEGSLHKRYVGQKRFSLEGGETMMPMIHTLLDHAAHHGVREAQIGMAHRGRLNVLVNVVGKPLDKLFCEFEDRTVATLVGSGDVKYHMGSETRFRGATGGELEVSLAPNPSHLEFVNPVIEGMVRARQDAAYGRDRKAVLPLLLHGEAAFAGQGVVFETINFANTVGYTTGGTIHIITNNQIGFTATSDEQRGTLYCTDLAKGIGAPVFHVNSEDIEGACWLMKLAIEYRQRFGKDVYVDLICYRKYGHNEGDDPTFTQPQMYSEIKAKKLLSLQYSEQLISEGVITQDGYDALKQDFTARFDAAHELSQQPQPEAKRTAGLVRSVVEKTSVSKTNLEKIAKSLLTLPQGFVPHTKLFKLLEKRTQSVFDGQGIEWGLAEALAFGALLQEGVGVRLSGQDCGRGTFSHRHAALDNSEKQEVYLPLSAVATEGSSTFEVINSVLSECAVLGFEFGYSHVLPKSLVMWEGQFGDFANGAQVMIDQYIVSSETKWGYMSGVVMLLPHGYEGQGPEHSSARLERYLQLCAEGNMSVCYPSNAAQYFHMLRRQGLSDSKRPLIVMTPKSLLRLADACCSLEALTKGSFEPVIEEVIGSDKKAPVTFFLSGKIYYDVVAELKKTKSNARVVRLEELYPLADDTIAKIIKGQKQIYWVQEEPKNQGAWNYILGEFVEKFSVVPQFIGRDAAASTATGSSKYHAIEQRAIIEKVVAAAKG